MKTHNLKTWPEFFQAVTSGDKTFEVRKDDRDFVCGDTLHLQEYDPEEGFTGESVDVTITYMLEGGQFGVEPGFVVMGFCPVRTKGEVLTYVCAACGDEFTSDRPDAEAEAEYQATFTPEEKMEPREIVCEDCWRDMGFE